MTIRSSLPYSQERTSRSPCDPNYLTLSSSSIQALTFSPRAMRAMLSIETLRSDRSTPLR
jgi:hypothetical protein